MARMVSEEDPYQPREVVRPHSSIPTVRNQQEVTEKIRRTKKITADTQFFKPAGDNGNTQKLQPVVVPQPQPLQASPPPPLPEPKPEPRHEPKIEPKPEIKVAVQIQLEPLVDPMPLPNISRKEYPVSTSSKNPFQISTMQIRPLSAQARKAVNYNNYFLNQQKPKEEAEKVVVVENFLSKQSPYQYQSFLVKQDARREQEYSQGMPPQVYIIANLQKKFTIYDIRCDSKQGDIRPQSAMIEFIEDQPNHAEDTRSPIFSQKQSIKEQKLRIRSAMNFFAPSVPKVQAETGESRPVVKQPRVQGIVKRYTLKDLE